MENKTRQAWSSDVGGKPDMFSEEKTVGPGVVLWWSVNM